MAGLRQHLTKDLTSKFKHEFNIILAIRMFPLSLQLANDNIQEIGPQERVVGGDSMVQIPSFHSHHCIQFQAHHRL
jgi:hypothetical protein